MTRNIIIQILLLITIFAIFYLFQFVNKSEASYVESSFDKNKYLVRNLDDRDEAAYMLSIIKARINVLKNYLTKHKGEPRFKEFKSYIEQLDVRTPDIVLIENAPDGNYTSYTVNKGDEIALCLRSKRTFQLHDLNLVMYVVLHELSHVACPEIDHTELFKKIFIFFLQNAVDIGIYEKIDYDIDPHEYCGLTISENLLRK